MSGSQQFAFVAPRANLAWKQRRTMAEMLFETELSDITYRLCIPARSHSHLPPSRRLQHPHCNNIVTIHSLPPEIHRNIYSFVGDIIDVISLGLTSRYFWSISSEYVEDYYTPNVGSWAGMNLVCVGDGVQPRDYPPGLFAAQELAELNQKRCPDNENQPFTLHSFASPAISKIYSGDTRPESNELVNRCAVSGIDTDPAYPFIKPYLIDSYTPRFAINQHWVLRNLTTKQFVRSEVIAPYRGYARGPFIGGGIGFGQVLVSRICWSTSPSTDIEDVTNITRGVWAGHRFDIVTRSRHEAQTCEEKWYDVSWEIASETGRIWEARYGPEWREYLHFRFESPDVR
ncbi:hypothetical protein F5X98DRAFT_368226 [Xylaria grammica]|nr:hypothetical protein F5X98DRAFT_368226 [Xylaria grammica]